MSANKPIIVSQPTSSENIAPATSAQSRGAVGAHQHGPHCNHKNQHLHSSSDADANHAHSHSFGSTMAGTDENSAEKNIEGATGDVGSSSTGSKVLSFVGENQEVAGDGVDPVAELVTAVRYGQHALVRLLLAKHDGSDGVQGKSTSNAFVDSYDASGYTAAHWAAKKGDVDMLAVLREHHSCLSLPTLNESRMLPIHWAASDGRVEAVRYIVEHCPRYAAESDSSCGRGGGSCLSIDAQDSNGYTPVVVATQYNQPTAALYCIKAGADMDIRDNNGDLAMHWAAYKGHVQLVGLLVHCTPQAVEQSDNYGQTPLHLASLRGNTEVVDFLLHGADADAQRKDKNSQTPLDIAVKKRHFKTEWTLRRHLFRSDLAGFVRSLGGVVAVLKNAKVRNTLFVGFDEREIARWPWRIVFWSNFIAGLLAFYFAACPELADLYFLHLCNTITVVCWFSNFFLCLLTPPGRCMDNKARQGDSDNSNGHHGSSNSNSKKSASNNSSSGGTSSQEAGDDAAALLDAVDADMESGRARSLETADYSFDHALDVISRAASSRSLHQDHLPAVCYTCRIRKPLRSKHCKLQRHCVHKFDHFCPFVYNTVGRDNYRYFLGLLLTHALGGTIWEVTAIYFAFRVPASILFRLFMLYSCLWLMVIFGLLTYHVQLVLSNLTTNEHLNFAKYAHMRDSYGDTSNPFDRKSVAANVLDALFPTKRSFYSREEVLLAKAQEASAGKRK